MADQKISELPTDASPARTDYLTSLEGQTFNVKGLVAAYLALVLDTDLTFSDITTGNASTIAHGYFPKIPSGVPGVLLGYTSYNPGTQADTVCAAGGTGEDVDAANLSVTFTVPPSGNVLIGLSATSYTGGAGIYWWNLRTTGGANVAGTRKDVNGTTGGIGTVTRVLVTGLTPGTSTTYRWGHGASPGVVGHTRYGDDGGTAPYGPAVMEVWAA